MATPFWVGDQVALSFTAKDGSAAGPVSATVDIYNETNTLILDDQSATVNSTTVSYTVAGSHTDVAGTYRAVFNVIFSGSVNRQHVTHFLIRDPAIRDSTYGSVAGVEMLVGDIVASRTFLDTTIPSFNTVQDLIFGIAAEINVELRQNGYYAPVRAAEFPIAYEYLVHANNAGASARVLSTMPMESYVMPTEERSGGDRREMLDRELWHCIQRIRRQELPAGRQEGLYKRMYAGSQKDRSSGATKNSVFSRSMFDNPGSRSLTS